jgi:hypothetical protein
MIYAIGIQAMCGLLVRVRAFRSCLCRFLMARLLLRRTLLLLV